MTYKLTIQCEGAGTSLTLVTKSAHEALCALQEYEGGGSKVEVAVVVQGSDEVYTILTTLDQFEDDGTDTIEKVIRDDQSNYERGFDDGFDAALGEDDEDDDADVR